VRDFHFYTLNRASLTYAICHALGLRPVARTAGAAAPGGTGVNACGHAAHQPGAQVPRRPRGRA